MPERKSGRSFGEEQTAAKHLAAGTGVWVPYRGFQVKRYNACMCLYVGKTRANEYPRFILHGMCHSTYKGTGTTSIPISIDTLLAQLVVLHALSTDVKFMQRLALSGCIHIYPGDHGA